MPKQDTIAQKQRHYFFLNPYEDSPFTKCPKCRTKTRIRKFPLAIHIEARQLLFLNKKCRYCTGCDLIIVKKAELESLMAATFERSRPEIIGNKYFVMGVAEREDWRERRKGGTSERQAIERMVVYKDVWNFEPLRPGWYADPEN